MRILGLIPARGGSKGIPRKNLAPFAGKPLIEWTFEAALAAPSLDDVLLSTDDEEIAECGRLAGLQVPFLRPAALAGDKTPTIHVVIHVLEELDSMGERYDAVCLLQPTNPLRLPEDIEAAVQILCGSDVDSVVSFAPIPDVHNPHWAYLENEDGTVRNAMGGEPISRRQDLPRAWYREGSIYVTRTAALLEQMSLYGKRILPYFMPADRCGGIDTREELDVLEQQFKSNGARKPGA